MIFLKKSKSAKLCNTTPFFSGTELFNFLNTDKYRRAASL